MFWFDKDNPLVEFMDIRDEDVYLTDGQLVMVHPNTIGDFTAMPFPDNSFKLVVFDPPHLVWAGKTPNMYKLFGRLEDWKTELSRGFKECFRVLEPYGVLIFKWSEIDLKLKTVLELTDEKPLFGHKRGKTFWVAFMKLPKKQ
jgi:SAM-dependent methyltransferase